MKRNPALQPSGHDTFDHLEAFDCVIDVRSPSEFADDHLPGAINHPVLDDQQRVEIGTLYKQVSPFVAKKLGAAMVSENIARHLREHLLDKPREWRPLIYCWRGGQRSGAMTTVLRQIGWDAKQLEGGYKAYRRHVVEELTRLPPLLRFIVVKGATGSAKTRILQAMAAHGAQIIDLEALAEHKGSVLGLVPETRQPSQKTFESNLLDRLRRLDHRYPVFIEAESRKIGAVHVPEGLIDQMRASACVRIEADRQARVEYLLRDYRYFTDQRDTLLSRLDALRPIRGDRPVEQWRQLALAGNWPAFVEAILGEHYDPLYQKSQATNYAAQGDIEQAIAATSLDDISIDRIAQELVSRFATAESPIVEQRSGRPA